MTRILLLVVAWLVPVAAFATVDLRWDRLPLPVDLIVGQERVLLFDAEVRVGIPAEARERIQAQSANGAVYLTAVEPFEQIRLQLQDASTNRVMLIDVTARLPVTPLEPLEPIRIRDATNAPQAGGIALPEDIRGNVGTPIPVLLTRYAAQSLYAPLRTVEPLSGISIAPIRLPKPVVDLLPDREVESIPLIAWQWEDYWVTAVRLRNLRSRVTNLDPRELRGDFLAATFQHNFLGPSGHPTDTTVLYVITRSKSFGNSTPPTIAPFDPAANLPGVAEGSHHEK
jgi:integrating conjugative element protein (TIGR03749 family)